MLFNLIFYYQPLLLWFIVVECIVGMMAPSTSMSQNQNLPLLLQDAAQDEIMVKKEISCFRETQ